MSGITKQVEQAREVANELMKQAVTNFERDGFLATVAFVVPHDRSQYNLCMVPSWDQHGQKVPHERWIIGIKEAASKLNAVAVMTICEAYFQKLEGMQKDDIAGLDTKGIMEKFGVTRRDGVAFSYEDCKGYSFYAIASVDAPKKLSEWDIMPDGMAEGRMVGLCPLKTDGTLQ